MTATNKRPAARNIAALLHVPDRHGLRQTLEVFARSVNGELADMDDTLAQWSVRAFFGSRLILLGVCVFTSSRIYSVGLEGFANELSFGEGGSLGLSVGAEHIGVRQSFPLKEIQPISHVTDERLLTERLREVWKKTVAQDQ